uniref:Immunoglobulin C1-set domain-containing protein n=1 Tax=Melopsittacus undulatus TaxID=13146 RepID=A0A8C6JCQ3_MELUD
HPWEETLSWLQTPAISSPHTISLLLLPDGDTWTVLVQTPKLQTQMQGTSTKIVCQLRAEVIMHWYKHLPGQPPTRILTFVKKTFRLLLFKNCILWWHICLLYSTDLLVLYCVISFPPLTNPGKGHSPPANSEILKKEHENQITYVCLVEKFYPEVIRVTWTDENNEEVTDSHSSKSSALSCVSYFPVYRSLKTVSCPCSTHD